MKTSWKIFSLLLLVTWLMSACSSGTEETKEETKTTAIAANAETSTNAEEPQAIEDANTEEAEVEAKVDNDAEVEETKEASKEDTKKAEKEDAKAVAAQKAEAAKKKKAELEKKKKAEAAKKKKADADKKKKDSQKAANDKEEAERRKQYLAALEAQKEAQKGDSKTPVAKPIPVKSNDAKLPPPSTNGYPPEQVMEVEEEVKEVVLKSTPPPSAPAPKPKVKTPPPPPPPPPAPEPKKEAPKPKSKSRTSSKPSISFAKQTHDFGWINVGDKVSGVFDFTNNGKAPLIISDANTACGCTIPKFPDYPIPPGESGKITVTFDSAGKVGVQNKSITIKSNAGNGNVTLFMKGVVTTPTLDGEEEKKEEEEKSGDAGGNSLTAPLKNATGAIKDAVEEVEEKGNSKKRKGKKKKK